MDSFKSTMAEDWLERLSELISELEQNDDGELTLVLDSLSQGKDELESIV